MSILGNILWLIFGGLIISIEYFIAGLLLSLTIIGIPFGIQSFKLAILALLPFGREVVQKPETSGCLSTFMNILWILLGGIWIAATHLIFAFLLAITIIGIPFAKQHLKLASLALTPFGHEIKG
ncbi:MAG TPA: YccF domain-containing protein [Ignavibacteria bacterium]|nr:YccF domain-containing protein [Ignavibacteria bacterium]